MAENECLLICVNTSGVRAFMLFTVAIFSPNVVHTWNRLSTEQLHHTEIDVLHSF